MQNDDVSQDPRYLMSYNCYPVPYAGPVIHDLEYIGLGMSRRFAYHELCLATSDDGIHWQPRGHINIRATDTVPCMYPARQGRRGYEFILRKDFGSPKLWRDIRGVQILWAKDLNFSSRPFGTQQRPESFEVLSSWYLDRLGKDEKHRRQVYAMTRSEYAGVYFGLMLVLEWPAVNPASYRAMRRKLPADQVDRTIPFLVVSRDGVHFDHSFIYAGLPFLPPVLTGPGARSKVECLQTAAQLITWQNHHWLYYTTTGVPHHKRWEGTEKVYLAKWPRNQIVGLTPSNTKKNVPGTVLTHPFLLPADEEVLRRISLHVYVEIEGLARCQVEIVIPSEGDTILVADLKTESSSLHVVRYPLAARSLLEVGGKAARLRFTLSGKPLPVLYAYEWQEQHV
eukprot:gnl/MRDRNA2_/MRDRNA2_141938_c0_seq1.p1 gnl/MRDRNA2_/MRDRNA2_141938_c0~~gnl/MRDRNA2_/MRDRNA2_141938_c0_seq1.p1  ORF type:complete len:408 (+),score=39.25 gnl/MRDRNA2_/MRDRNA2_141938_c0_seq1:39-1226(+)